MKPLTKLNLSNEEILQSLTRYTSDIIAICDRNARILAANRATMNFFKKKNGKTWHQFNQLITNRDKNIFSKSFNLCVKGKKEQNIYCSMINSKNKERIFNLTLVKLNNKDHGKQHILVSARDVTDLISAKRQIKILATTVTCTHDAFVLTDLKGKSLFVSPSTTKIYKYSEKEILGKNIKLLRSASFSSSEQKMIIDKALKEGWEGGSIDRRKDGTEFPVEIWAYPMYDEDHKALALIWVMRDVSKRKEAEAKLKNITERLQLTLDNLNILVFELDPRGKFLLLRGKALEKLRLKPDQVIGVSAFKLYKDYPQIVDLLKKVCRGEQIIADVEINGYMWSVNSIPLRDKTHRKPSAENQIFYGP